MRILITLITVLLAVALTNHLVAPPTGFWFLASLFLLMIIIFRGVMYVVFRNARLRP